MTRPNDTYLSTRQAAETVGLSCSWLEKLRASGDGPPYFKISPRRVLYGRQDLIDWVECHRVRTTSEVPGTATSSTVNQRRAVL